MRLWVSKDRTLLVREHDDGSMEAATRPEPDAVWGPPFLLREENATYDRRVAFDEEPKR